VPNAKLKQKLTKTVVEGLAAEPAEYSVWDTTVESFHVRVSPKGTKTLCVIYRTKRGVSRRRSLGRFPTKRIEEARDEARTYISAAKSGGDPFGERDALKAIPTLGKFWDEYWSDHATVKKSARSCESDLQLWKTHLSPRFGRSHVDQVEPATIYRWHAALSEKPGAANRALALLSRLMSLAVV
jgi:hypothetical protein